MDKKDIQILSLLLNNCRESDRQIGKKIGITGAAVSTRIKKLIQNGIIESFSLKIEPPVLGYGVFYLVVSGQDIDQILKQVRLVGDPFFVVPCVGGITVVSIVVKEDVQQKIELTKNLMKDIRVLSMFEAESPGVNSSFTKTDLEIINALLKNPREKIDNLAATTGLSTKTVTRSLDKLHENEAFQFTLIYDPTKIEGYIPYAILAWINGDMKKVLKSLEDKFSNSFLQKPFIAKNQIVLFFYSNDIFNLDDLTQKVRNVPGVESADLFIPKKINFPQQWIINAIKEAKKSPSLHLVYPTH